MTQRTYFPERRAFSGTRASVPGSVQQCPRGIVWVMVAVVAGLAGHGGASTALNPASSAQTEPCDVSLPISIAIEPMAAPRPGARTPFEVAIEIGLDPDDVRSIQIEYDLPESFRTEIGFSERLLIHSPQPRSRFQIGMTIPDERRYSVRARLIVELTSGERLSESAVCWIDIGNPDRPPGMIDRLVEPDGSGIRVYQGTSRGHP